MSADDFPNFIGPEGGHKINLPGKPLGALIASVDGCISTEETRYYLNGICFLAVGDVLRAIATDGHRLARSDVPAAGAAGMPPVIVPTKAVANIKALAEKNKGDVEISADSGRIQFSFSDGTVLRSKLIDGTFPDVERVIPRNNDKLIRADRAGFAAVVSRVATFTSKMGHAVKLEFMEGRLAVSARSETDEASEEMEIAYEGPPIEIGFDARYLASHLAALNAETIVMKMQDPGTPAIMQDEENGPLLLLIMPLRV